MTYEAGTLLPCIPKDEGASVSKMDEPPNKGMNLTRSAPATRNAALAGYPQCSVDVEAPLTRKWSIDRFDALADKPLAWHETAAHYIAAANFLFEVDKLPGDWSTTSVGTNWPVMLLYATAAENLLKAIRIAQGAPVVVDGQLAKYFASHDLLKFATDANVTGPCQRA